MTHTIPQHIQDKANSMIAKGAKMSFEAICAMYIKSEGKKKTFKAAIGTKGSGPNASVWLAEKNRENALKNLPSSLR